MQRKPGFPVTNCAIKMPESVNSSTLETVHGEDDVEQQHRRQQLINFGHAQWGFKNWSWSVTKQDLDFVDFTNGKFCVGAVAFVSITVKTIDIHRENIGYATSLATSKGLAIYKSRKCAVTNALRETLLSFGGTVASELMECLEARAPERPAASPPAPQPPAPKPEPKVEPPTRVRKEPEVNVRAAHVPLVANPPPPVATAHPLPPVATAHPLPVATAHPLPVATAHPLPIATAHPLPPVATAHPLPGRVPPPRPPAAPLRPNSNVSFVLQPVMPPLYAPPRLPPAPPLFPNAYYECSGPWHFYDYDRAHGNVNLNFNIPPKSLVVNGRNGSVECKNVCRNEGELPYGPQQGQGCWIKPTIFYDGFWTEQKVKKWVAEQVEKQFPEEHAREPHDAKS